MHSSHSSKDSSQNLSTSLLPITDILFTHLSLLRMFLCHGTSMCPRLARPGENKNRDNLEHRTLSQRQLWGLTKIGDDRSDSYVIQELFSPMYAGTRSVMQQNYSSKNWRPKNPKQCEGCLPLCSTNVCYVNVFVRDRISLALFFPSITLQFEWFNFVCSKIRLRVQACFITTFIKVGCVSERGWCLLHKSLRSSWASQWGHGG